jgi:hypothetical protein
MEKLIIGTSALPDANVALIKDAGIGWIRQDFPFPFVDRIGGVVSEDYRRARAAAQGWAGKGLRLMGVSPLPGIGGYKLDAAGKMQMVWKDWFPAWMGAVGSREYFDNYREACAFLAQDLSGVVQMWQIANELDIPLFAGPLNPRQAAELILHGAQGLKSADPWLIVGPNTAGGSAAYYLYGRLYADPSNILDYCGVDGYYGSWATGGPENWAVRIPELYSLTNTRVLVNEWGFASRGEVMSADEQKAHNAGATACQYRRWPATWSAGHTPEVQAEFVRQVIDGFIAQRDMLYGMFFYRWEDQERCWQCGSPDCPLEIAWGLVDVAHQPKPAYFTFQEGVRRLLT